MGQTWTLARWLRYWLASRDDVPGGVRPGTLRYYRQNVDRYLIPHLGQRKLAELSSRDITGMLHTLIHTSSRHGRPPAVSTLRGVYATLRAALNAAVREEVIGDNPARRVRSPGPYRRHAEVWTEPRVEWWRATGEHPAVAVWTAQHLVQFLDYTRIDRLFGLWWLVALRGLRRGEVAGLRWTDIDLERGELTVVRQLTTCGTTLVVNPPKSAASRRTIALDRATVQVLRQQRRQQQADRNAAGIRWVETGLVFTRPDGTPLKPDYLSQRFRILVKRADLPPVRLHDLRHSAASLAHTAALTSNSSRPSSATRASCSPPTPTPASYPPRIVRPPKPRPGLSSPPLVVPAAA
jgi:integrase